MGNEVEARTQCVRDHLQRPDHSDWQLTNAKSADWRPVGAPWFAKIRRWSPVVLASGAAGSLPVFVVVVPGKTLVLLSL
jgi:hypothetical protein